MHLDKIIGAWALNPNAEEAVRWANVYARSRMAVFVVVYILLLGAALYHGLYGLRTILFELGFRRRLQTAINVVFWIGGIGLFVIGTYAAIAAKMM
jgi:succinate dehydrogenase / fumarate reductase membrane anchor subunit